MYEHATRKRLGGCDHDMGSDTVAGSGEMERWMTPSIDHLKEQKQESKNDHLDYVRGGSRSS